MRQIKHPVFGKSPVGLGRRGEFKVETREDRDRLAWKIGQGIFSGDTLWLFPDRSAMHEYLNKHDRYNSGDVRWIPVVR